MGRWLRHHVVEAVPGHIIGWVIGGAIIAASGVSPEDWMANIARAASTLLPSDWAAVTSPLVARFSFAALGFVIVASSLIVMRRGRAGAGLASATLSAAASGATATAPLALPDKPSIAVLPFQNMSGDAEQEYFADGVVEEIITALSRVKWLFVIARNSSFAYKGKSPDIRDVGRELGVRYVLEGSVRKAGNRIRIAGQLVDATNGAHIWADRFEGGLDDVFDLQDRVTASVVGAIDPALKVVEAQRVQVKPTASMTAYDFYLRAIAAFHRSTRASTDEALALCRKAIELDRGFAAAYGWAAFCCLRRRTHGWAQDSNEELISASEFVQKAIELGSDDPEALVLAGTSLPYFGGRMDRAIDLIERGLAHNSNWALAWASLGMMQGFSGNGDKAVESLMRATRLSPLDPESFTFKTGMALGHFVEGRYEQALDWADQAYRQRSNFLLALRLKIAASGLLGRPQDAKEAIALAQSVDPDITVSKSLRITPFQRPEQKSVYAEGLRKAGLPE